jgi:hypothetical protein
MWVVAILRVKNSKIKIEMTLRIIPKSVLFSQKFSAKLSWVSAILRVKNIKIKL